MLSSGGTSWQNQLAQACTLIATLTAAGLISALTQRVHVQYRWGNNLQLWPHWNINLHMPEVEGYAHALAAAVQPAVC